MLIVLHWSHGLLRFVERKIIAAIQPTSVPLLSIFHDIMVFHNSWKKFLVFCFGSEGWWSNLTFLGNVRIEDKTGFIFIYGKQGQMNNILMNNEFKQAKILLALWVTNRQYFWFASIHVAISKVFDYRSNGSFASNYELVIDSFKE